MGEDFFLTIMIDETETRVDEHIKILKGEVQVSSIFYLNDTNVQAKARFNVYLQNVAFLAHLKTHGVEYTNPQQFVDYLIDSELIKVLKKPNRYVKKHAKQIHYKTFPFSPTYKEIVSGLQKIVLILTPLEILTFGIEETYMFCMLEFLGVDTSATLNETFRVRMARLLSEGKERLRQKEYEWLTEHNLELFRQRFK